MQLLWSDDKDILLLDRLNSKTTSGKSKAKIVYGGDTWAGNKNVTVTTTKRLPFGCHTL